MTESVRRLFIALTLPAPVKKTLSALPRRGLDARWQSADDLHITIRFLGEVSAVQEEAVIAALNTVKRPPFGVEMAGLAVFEGERQHILYAPIVSTRKLTTLCAEITDALTPVGFDFGLRPYVPHITLARLNQPRGIDDYIKSHTGAVRAQWQANDFHLLQSAGAVADSQRYTARARFLLR